MKTVDLFCGCGGMSLGFQNAGYDIVLAVDNWQPAIDVYKKNFKHKILNFDLKNHKKIIKVIKPLKPEIIIGGPPCQDFSIAGPRNKSKGRSALTIKFSMIIAKIRPKFFVMENVPRITKSNELITVISILKRAGYVFTKVILDSSDFEIPQYRKRFFLIGALNAKKDFLSNIMNQYKSNKKISIRDYFNNKLAIDYYFRIPTTYSRRAVFSIDEPSVTIRAVDRPIPKNYRKHPKDLVSVNNKKVRCFTTKERSLIQTFPEKFIFNGTKTDQNIMIGNAVPVELCKIIAKSLKIYESKKNENS